MKIVRSNSRSEKRRWRLLQAVAAMLLLPIADQTAGAQSIIPAGDILGPVNAASNGSIIDGGSANGFFVNSGGLEISNATLMNFNTTGGAGSGGGAGLGGAIFVNSGATVRLNNVSFLANSATGGAGGLGTVGGVLNNILTPVNNGVNGFAGANYDDGGIFFDGNGGAGLYGLRGGNSLTGFGGAGGHGGNGSDGWSTNPILIASVALETIHVVAAGARLAGVLAPNIGLTGPVAADPAEIAAATADVADAGAQLAIVTADLATWQIANENGAVGLGGAGGAGGMGGRGGFGFGGGAGGDGGNGGNGAGGAKGGDGGDGGSGGTGGFGGGGGSGGNGGFGGAPGGGFTNILGVTPSVPGLQGNGGSGGMAGFGAGLGSTGVGYNNVEAPFGGGGGSGYGGSIFVRSGGSLVITGNALFDGGRATGGSSFNGGTAGEGVGTDLFMMRGSSVTLSAGAGNTIVFNGTIADDSQASIANTSIAAGQGAGLTVESGLVIFNGANTYTGQTRLTGGVLQALDGVGLHQNSNLNFDGGVFQSTGGFSRYLGTGSNRVQWSGSGGFAAAGGGLNVSLNNGQTLTWGRGNFVPGQSSLVFGSDSATDAVTFRNNVDLAGGVRSIVSTDGASENGAVIFTGALTNGGVVINDEAHQGTVTFAGGNSYSGGTTILNGTLRTQGQGTIGDGAVYNYAALDLSAGGTQRIDSLWGNGLVNLGTQKLVITGHGGNFSGTIAGTSGVPPLPSAGLLRLVATPRNDISTGGLEIEGSLTLSGVNTYSGPTVVLPGASLALTSSGKLSGQSALTVDGTFDVSQSPEQTIGALSGSGAVMLGGGRLFINSSADSTFNGSIQDGGLIAGTGGQVFKVGTGTLTLTGANTYTGGTVINEGTLAVASGGTLYADGAILNNGTLDLSQAGSQTVGNVIGTGAIKTGVGALALGTSASSTFGGVLTGTGAFTKQGSGVVTLTGNSTFTGQTLVKEGVLQVGDGGETGSLGSGAIVTDALLAVNRSNNYLISAPISGTGTFATIGSGTTILTGANTYSGGTVIENGALQIGNGGRLGSLAAAPVLNNGALIFNLRSNLVAAADISGSGALIQRGEGTTILTGANSYGGPTWIEHGTLQLGNGGAGGSLGAGTIVNNSRLAIDLSRDLVLPNAITGSGSLFVNGTGTVYLSNPAYTGATNIEPQAALNVTGSMATRQVNISRSGAFTGSASIAGNVSNQGWLMPGSGTGALAIGGNFSQALSGALRLEIAAPFDYDTVQIGGRAKLGGTLSINLLNGYLPRLGQVFNVLSASQGVYGKFANTSSANALGLQVQYHGRAVTLKETKNLFEIAATTRYVRDDDAPASVRSMRTRGSAYELHEAHAAEQGMKAVRGPALTGNERSVARALDAHVLESGRTELDSPVLAWLTHDAAENLRGDFARLSPQALSSIYQGAFASANALGDNLDLQLDSIRAGFGRGGDIALTTSGKSIVTSSDMAGERLRLWTSGNVEFTEIDGDARALGYDVTTGGATAGLDYRFGEHFAAGLYFDYTNTDADLPFGGSLDANGGKGGVYASLFGKNFFLNAMVGGGANSFEASREALGGTARGSSTSSEFEARITAGYDAHLGALTLSPYASLQYTDVHLNGYEERGSIAPLKIQSHSEVDTRLQAGLRLAYEKKFGSATVRPTLHAAWEHDFSGERNTIYARLADGGSRTIAADSAALGSDGAILGGGVSVNVGRASFYINDSFRVGRSGYRSNEITGGVRLSF